MTLRSGLSALKLFRFALLASPLLFVTTGCNPECVDKFDCKAIESRPENVSAKKKFTCSEAKCVECPAAGCPTGEGPGGGAGGGSAGGAGGGSAGGAGGGSAGGAGGGSAGGAGGGGGAGGAGGGSAGGAGGGGGAGGAGGGTVNLAGVFVAKMTANQEVPPTTSTGAGTVTVTVSNEGDGGYLATMSGTLTGFGAEVPTAVHIHNKHAGVSGGFLGGSAGNFAIAAATGIVTGATPFTPAQITEIVEGRAYVNVHSAATNPGGAVRGQLLRAGQVLASSQLSGAESVPSNPYPAGLGGVGYIINTDGGVSYEGTWPANVDATQSHIHQGGPGGSGGIVITLALNGATGVKGFFSAATLAAGNTDGGLYTNVHTSDAGTGLIRGNYVTH